ncbi:hypothetical protein [Candidatus Paracaedibacter symbiosus]|uniref:hypothetical protein n=1 Tax=Candidatus Paracaedibacter symbiosus TaxID=244582 RepID=UPI000509AD58|nr:hypothetical protein [Candidatus Paracaedibacter symbiosus]
MNLKYLLASLFAVTTVAVASENMDKGMQQAPAAAEAPKAEPTTKTDDKAKMHSHQHHMEKHHDVAKHHEKKCIII